MITRNEKKPAGETLVAFFAGTGYDVGIAEQPNNNFYNNRYLSTNRVKSKSSHAKNCDIGFSDLQYSLANRNNCFAYDGCHRRGGGLFAFGVVEPATHLYRELKSRLEGKNQKMTLVLTAHSRGCLSALILAKKINKDSQLRNKVNIILDLRDPVPGNLNVSTKLDFAKIATISAN